MSSQEREKFDVVIAGAGPAGSAAAIRLAKGGLNVLIVEKARFPREKLCGEFVSPECLRHFSDLGIDSLLTGGHPLIESTVFYSEHDRSVEFESSWFDAGRSAVGISRAEMDEALLDGASAAGATIWAETSVVSASTVSKGAVAVKVRGSDGEARVVEASIAIDASGRKRLLSSTSGPKIKAAKIAFKTHLANARIPSSVCEIYSYRGGYGGCNAVGENRYNLCFIVDARLTKSIGSDGEKVMRSVLFRNAAAKRALADASFDEKWLAVPVSGFGRRPPVEDGRIFFIGDSAAFIDPFTGSGILLALQSAEICANSILWGFHEGVAPELVGKNYERSYGKLLGNRLRISSLLRPASNSPRLAEVVLSVVSKSAALRAAIARATRFSGAPGV